MPNKRRSLLLSVALSSVLGAAAHAQTTPTPDALNAIQKQIEQSKAQQEELKAKAEALDKEIADLQAAAIKAAHEVQETESQVTELEDTLAALSDAACGNAARNMQASGGPQQRIADAAGRRSGRL